MINLISQAEMERSQQEHFLAQKIAAKKAKLEKDLGILGNQFSERLEAEDIYEIEARDKITDNRMTEKIAQLVQSKAKGVDANGHAI